MRIKFPSALVHKRSQILMLRSKPLFFWPRRILLFSLRTSLFDSQLLNVYRVFFCLQLETNLSVSCLEAQNALFVIQVVFFVYLVKLKIYFWLFYFHWGRKKREDNYLWQWIIEIFTNTQPYKLCTKRKTKTGEVLSREITELPSLCIAQLWFMYAHQVFPF